MMPKKYLSKKSKSTAEKIKSRGFFFYLLRYFSFVFVAVIGFSVTSFALSYHNPSPTCANSASCTSDLKMQINNGIAGLFEGKIVQPPQLDPAKMFANASVLGASTISQAKGEKHIYVDLKNQTLYAYQGNTLFMKALVSTGKWGPTPVGNFHIWEKLVATRMAGGEGADAYDLPNVPYVMYFYNDWGLHGAYWHDNFGHPMSHGCVNIRIVDAHTLYDWADGPQDSTPGTAVSVCDEISNNQCIQNNPIN